MEKPEDIPQDVWLKADVLASEYSGVRQVEMIARAILAAVDEEREALPDAIDLFRFLKNNRLRKRADIAKAVAATIRNRKGA